MARKLGNRGGSKKCGQQSQNKETDKHKRQRIHTEANKARRKAEREAKRDRGT